MCPNGGMGGAFLLLPLYIVLGIGEEILIKTNSIDNRIRENNLAIFQFFERSSKKIKEMAPAYQLDRSTSASISLVKDHSSNLNEEEKNELAQLLLQRSVSRMEQGKFVEAKEDIMEVLELIPPSQHNFIMYFMKGCVEYSLGEFRESANSFMRAIVERESLDYSLIEELERQYVNMQLSSKPHVERAVANIGNAMNNLNKGVANATSSITNFFNHDLKLNEEQPIIEKKPKETITLELLYNGAGMSYYSGGFYLDAIKCFSTAIEIGSRYKSEHLEATYYSRGLCYYLSHMVDEAINDFSNSISLMPLHKQRYEAYLMKAVSYSRKGQKSEYNSNMLKARLINPFVKPPSLFHYRLLPDESLLNIISFLDTKDLLSYRRVDKYWKQLITTHVVHNQIPISFYQLTSNKHAIEQNSRTVVEKVFLPQKYRKFFVDFMKTVLCNPFLQTYAKDLNIYRVYEESDTPFKYITDTNQAFDMLEFITSEYKNIKRLTISHVPKKEITDNIIDNLNRNSPNLSYLDIRETRASPEVVEFLISSLPNLEHLSLSKMCFLPGDNPFRACSKLKIVEYQPNNKEAKTKQHSCAEYNPHIQFILSKTKPVFKEAVSMSIK